MEQLVRDAVSLAFDDVGSGEPALALVHGLGCDHADFSAQISHYRGHRRVIAVDLRGHGASGRAASYDLASYVDDLAFVLERREVGRALLVGHSFGGMIALELAARAAPQVAGVVVLDAGMFLPPAFLTAVGPAFAAMTKPGGAAVWRGFLAEAAFGPGADPLVREAILERAGRFPEDVLAASVAALLGFDAESAVRRCRVPLLYLGAVMPTDVLRLTELCPGARAEAIPAGHFLQIEAADRVNELLDGMLATLA